VIWADSVSVQDSTVKFVVGMIGLSYEGKLSSNGDTITGTWIQGDRTPFTFRKATKETALSVNSRDAYLSWMTTNFSLEPGVFRLGLLEDRNIGVSIFP
jgi:hypothetical protein